MHPNRRVTRSRAHRAPPTHRPAPPVLPAVTASVAPEREVRLEIPPDRLEDVRDALAGGRTQRASLQAFYFDTPDCALARVGISVRLRREPAGWIQTVKAPAGGLLERREDNVPSAPPTGNGKMPALDLGRHAMSTQAALRKALAVAKKDALPPLQVAFEVRVERTLRQATHGKSRIELALDEGVIEAAGRTQVIRELELELKAGQFADVLELARRWCQGHGLWLSVISKAARGARLVVGQLYGEPVGAPTLDYPRDVTMGQLAAALLGSCLDQVIGNASEIASGSNAPEHVHELRVGIRRLRTALRAIPLLATAHARCETPLVEAFRALGTHRDRTHVMNSIQPLVEAAGGPALRLPPAFHQGLPLGEIVREPGFQECLLALLAQAEKLRSQPGPAVRRTFRPVLEKLFRQVRRDGARFTELEEERQHQVRKRLKRLRYLSEFLAPLFERQDVEAFLGELKPMQDALGKYNDEIMAAELYRELSATEPAARFGVKWLARRRDRHARGCRKQLRELGDARRYWRQ